MKQNKAEGPLDNLGSVWYLHCMDPLFHKQGTGWTPKMVSFFTAGSWEKDTISGAARKFFGPSYFVTALGGMVLWLGSSFYHFQPINALIVGQNLEISDIVLGQAAWFFLLLHTYCVRVLLLALCIAFLAYIMDTN